MFPQDAISSMRWWIGAFKPPGLQAATFEFDEHKKHLHIDFFFSGTSEDVDLEQIEDDALGQLLADVWQNIETAGFAVFFDQRALDMALANPSRLYP
jgi:hypothetical protein